MQKSPEFGLEPKKIQDATFKSAVVEVKPKILVTGQSNRKNKKSLVGFEAVTEMTGMRHTFN